MSGKKERSAWPALAYADWAETAATLHMWTQIVGKIRLQQTPWVNHSCHVPLYLTARGLTTSPIPHGDRTLQIGFDFVDHRLVVETSEGGSRELPLEPRSTADFYDSLMLVLDDLDFLVSIHGSPNDVEGPIPFAEDDSHYCTIYGELR